jgi:hypothetical protein
VTKGQVEQAERPLDDRGDQRAALRGGDGVRLGGQAAAVGHPTASRCDPGEPRQQAGDLDGMTAEARQGQPLGRVVGRRRPAPEHHRAAGELPERGRRRPPAGVLAALLPPERPIVSAALGEAAGAQALQQGGAGPVGAEVLAQQLRHQMRREPQQWVRGPWHAHAGRRGAEPARREVAER